MSDREPDQQPDSAQADSRNDLLPRVLSSLVMIPLIGYAIFEGGLVLKLVLCAVGALMAFEWANLLGDEERKEKLKAVLLAAVLIPIGVGFFWRHLADTVGIGLISALITMTIARQIDLQPVKYWSFLAIVSVTFPIGSLAVLRAITPLGMETVFWILACVVATDVCAYLVGRAVGGPKLAPSISPGKTWSGLAGGVAGSVLASYAAAFYVEGSDLQMLLLFGGGIALVAQFGDLTQSKIKRHFKIKDSGNLIPGHGGILDRVDGYILVFPIMAAVCYYSRQSVLAW